MQLIWYTGGGGGGRVRLCYLVILLLRPIRTDIGLDWPHSCLELLSKLNPSYFFNTTAE